MVHIAWDERTIEAAIADVFRPWIAKRLTPKSTKTRCGKRVPYQSAQTRAEATCEECIAEYDEQVQVIRRALETVHG